MLLNFKSASKNKLKTFEKKLCVPPMLTMEQKNVSRKKLLGHEYNENVRLYCPLSKLHKKTSCSNLQPVRDEGKIFKLAQLEL